MGSKCALTVGVLAEGDAVPCLGGMLDVVAEHLATGITTSHVQLCVRSKTSYFGRSYIPLASTLILSWGQKLAYL